MKNHVEYDFSRREHRDTMECWADEDLPRFTSRAILPDWMAWMIVAACVVSMLGFMAVSVRASLISAGLLQ